MVCQIVTLGGVKKMMSKLILFKLIIKATDFNFKRFYLRLKEANLTINRPDVSKFKTGKKYTFFHNHLADKRPRDKKRFLKQKQEALQLDQTGLNNLKYRIDKMHEIRIDNYDCTVVDVELFCDKTDTHWCSMKYQFIDD